MGTVSFRGSDGVVQSVTFTVASPVTTDAVRPYDPTGPWNTPIGSAALDPNSAKYVTAISNNNMALTCDPDQYTIPLWLFNKSTPVVTVNGTGSFSTFDSGDLNRVSHGWPVQVPMPPGASSGSGTDGQIIIWDPVQQIEYGFWQLKQSGTAYTATNGYRTHTGTGYNGRMANAGRGGGTTYFAGLVRPWEITQGHIDHALAFAYSSPSKPPVYPATKSDGAGVAGTDAPEGTRFQLDPTLTDAQLTALGLDPMAKIIAKALQVYGMYVIDNSGSSKIYIEDRKTAKWDTSVTRNIISAIPWSKFHIVAPPTPNY